MTSRRIILWKPVPSETITITIESDRRLHLWHPLAPRLWLPAGSYPGARIASPFYGVDDLWIVTAYGGRLVGGPEMTMFKHLTVETLLNPKREESSNGERNDDWQF